MTEKLRVTEKEPAFGQKTPDRIIVVSVFFKSLSVATKESKIEQ